MSIRSESASVTSRVQSRRRYWRRTESPQPWWPWGLLPMLALGLLFLFGALVTAPDIQAEVRETVADRLDGVGVIATEVASNGQGIAVQARSAAQDEMYLRALAQSTQCETWAGPLTCPTTVSVSLDRMDVATQSVPIVQERRAHPFTVVRTGNAVTLTGEVPNLAEHDRILGVAGRQFEMVKDELAISNDTASENYSHAADQALAIVGHLNGGQASWSGEALSVNGIANENAVAPARQQFAALGSGSILGEFEVRTANDRLGCNEQFRNAMSNATIRFQTSSATIDAGNDELLRQLADIARSCPGNLTIEGHTDSRGDAIMNEVLSRARALAVRDALAELGIVTERLNATGFGESQPVADNDTRDGRAKNRRIAITMDELN